jgi:hypothetical protein
MILRIRRHLQLVLQQLNKTIHNPIVNIVALAEFSSSWDIETFITHFTCNALAI